MPCLAGDGWVHKALNLGSHVHLVEELQVFEPEIGDAAIGSQRDDVGQAPRSDELANGPRDLDHRKEV